MKKFKIICNQFYKNIVVLTSYFIMNLSQCYATYFEGIEDSGTPEEVAKKTVTSLSDLMVGIGIVILAWGIGELILAFKDDHPENKSTATMKVLAGIILITIEAFLTEAGLWIE